MARSALRSCSVYSRICTEVSAKRVRGIAGHDIFVPLRVLHMAACQAVRTVHLQNRLASDARAGMNAEAIASARDAVGKDAAPAGRQRRGASRATTGDGDWRRTERNRSGRQRADVLRIGAPIERLIAKLHVQVARGSHKIDAWSAECGRRVRLRKIKQARPRV